MAKKTFKDNPALQFISSAGEDTHNKQDVDNTEYTYNKDNARNTGNKHSARNTENTDNTGNKQERKTKRLNLLLQPSVLDNLSKIAHMKQTSVNDLINSVLKNYAETEKDSVIMYDKIFNR